MNLHATLELTAAQRLALIDRRTSKGYDRGDSEFMLDRLLDHSEAYGRAGTIRVLAYEAFATTKQAEALCTDLPERSF